MPGTRARVPGMADPFDLIGRGDLAGLRAALAADPGLARARSASGESLLAHAAYLGNAEAVEIVRAAVVLDPYEAIILGETESVRAFLAEAWDANELSPDGFTPLGLAAYFNRSEIFDLLLPLTRDVNAAAANPQRVAALHAATAARNAGMVERLLRAGADPDQRQAGGVTALHAAARHGDAAIVALLLLFGADPGLSDASGSDATAHARSAGHAWLAERLEAVSPL